MNTKQKYKFYKDFKKSKKIETLIDLLLILAIMTSVLWGFGLLMYNLYTIFIGGLSGFLITLNIVIIAVYLGLVKVLKIRLEFLDQNKLQL